MATYQSWNFTNVPASALGASDGLKCSHLVGKTITLHGGGSWDADVEVSTDDGSTWYPIHTGLISGEISRVNLAVTDIRVNVKTWTSGTPAASIAGWLKV